MRLNASSLKQLPTSLRKRFLTSLTDAEAACLYYDWPFWARDAQVEPAGTWSHWLILAGRGFGKTRTGAEWVRQLAERGTTRRIALVAPTLRDARHTMVEGESGLLAISPPWFRPFFEPSKYTVTWPNGVQAVLFSADQPERLRGPQHDAAWCDELCAWRYAQDAWDQLMFGLRLGDRPRTCITTTPKPTPLLKSLMGQSTVALTTGSTFDNLDNLAASFADEIVARYQGTRLGRQELMAEILDDVPGALWTRSMIEAAQQLGTPPRFERVVVALDPPVTTGDRADACGLIAAARGSDGRAYVLRDGTSQGLSPLAWAQKAVALYHDIRADRLVVEVNQGGAMVRNLLEQVDRSVAIREVHATRGKALRAEPVAALYEQGRVRHLGAFPALEDQLCSFTGSALPGGKSPDRLDALVWALTDLMLQTRHEPQLRKL